jgi:hypothetical protein
MKSFILLISLCAIAGLSARCQSLEDLMLANQQEITKLVHYYASRDVDQMARGQALARQMTDFSTRLEKTSGASDEYKIVLINYHNLLKKANTHTNAEADIIAFISTDINLKFSSLPALALNEQLSGKVNVHVEVVDASGNKISGYNVSARFYLNTDDAFFVEFNPTNNASKDMLPGWYMIWISKNGIKTAEKSEHVSVSENNDFIFNVQ